MSEEADFQNVTFLNYLKSVLLEMIMSSHSSIPTGGVHGMHGVRGPRGLGGDPRGQRRRLQGSAGGAGGGRLLERIAALPGTQRPESV